MVDVGFLSLTAIKIDDFERHTSWFEQDVGQSSDTNVVDLRSVRHDVLSAVVGHGEWEKKGSEIIFVCFDPGIR